MCLPKEILFFGALTLMGKYPTSSHEATTYILPHIWLSKKTENPHMHKSRSFFLALKEMMAYNETRRFRKKQIAEELTRHRDYRADKLTRHRDYRADKLSRLEKKRAAKHFGMQYKFK